MGPSFELLYIKSALPVIDWSAGGLVPVSTALEGSQQGISRCDDNDVPQGMLERILMINLKTTLYSNNNNGIR